MTAQSSLLMSRAGRVTVLMSAFFLAYGVMLPFLSRWLEAERGLIGAQIGLLLSLAQLSRIITGPAVATLADRARDRRGPLRILAFTAALAFAGFFFVAQGYPALVAGGFVALTLIYALSPLIEAATLRACEGARLSYGVARGIGSSSFIGANVLGGMLIGALGPGVVSFWIVGSLIATGLLAIFFVKPEPPPIDAPASGAKGVWRSLLSSRAYLTVIISCGLIQAAHAFYYGFSVLVWRAQGVSAQEVGLLWACGVAAEVALFWSLPRIEPRFSPQVLIIAGGVGGALRWLLMGFAPTGWVLWPIQAMHALSFASAHIGAMRLIFRLAPDAASGRAQTLYSALSSGLFMGLSSLGSGVLFDAIGARGYWAMSGLALVGAALALPLLRLVPDARPAR